MSTLEADAITASTGTNTNLALTGKGTGKVAIGDAALLVPDADGAAGQILTTDGSLALTFAATPGTSGNVLTSNGSAWTSSAGSAAGTTYASGELTGGSATHTRSSWITLVMETELADSGTTYDLTTFTVPSGAGGVYLMNAFSMWDFTSIGNDGEAVYIRFNKNSGTYFGYVGTLNIDHHGRYLEVTSTSMISLAATDTIILEGMSMDGNASGVATWLEASFNIMRVA